MSKISPKFFLALLVGLANTRVALASDFDRAIAAMETELNRSLKELRLENAVSPYFISYRLTAIEYYSVSCTHGDIATEEREITQVPFVELRVGSYDLDNTWEGFATGRYAEGGSLRFDETSLRQIFWRLSDLAYKDALRKYFDKKARLAQELEEEKLPDFSKEKPATQKSLSDKMPSLNTEALRQLCQGASAEFKKYPSVDSSEVGFQFSSETRILVNTEGTRLIEESKYTPYSFGISGEARAPDGLKVSSFRNGNVRYASEFPAARVLADLVKEVAEEVVNLKNAPVQMPEAAPAMLDGVSTGVFFHEALGHRLEGSRQREKGELQTFKGKVGQRIIPTFLTIISDPTMRAFGQQTLSGHFDFDSEGVLSQRVMLVEKGVLKNYLLSRRPIGGFLNSNGNGRAGAGNLAEGRMSVLIVDPIEGLSQAKLRERFLDEIKSRGKGFGFRMVAMRSGEAQTNRGQSQSFVARPRLIYEVDGNGHETLIRGLEYVGTPLTAIDKIVAAGDNQVLGNAYCGAASGWVPVSHIAPSVVFSELELQREPEERLRPPLLKPPIALQ